MGEREPFIRAVELEWEKMPESYGNKIPALRKTERLTFRRPVTFFVGENGSGKSTLLEAIAVKCGFHPEGGTRNFRFETNETPPTLLDGLTALKSWRPIRDGFFFRAESFYNVATQIDRYEAEGGYGGQSLHTLSHGEGFLALAENRLAGNGLYLLDEPEAALSPQRQLSFLRLCCRAAEAGAQFLIATHSPILLGTPGAEILLFGEEGIRPVAYEETESYVVTKSFLERHDAMIRELLRED